jgi:hypothetical protein
MRRRARSGASVAKARRSPSTPGAGDAISRNGESYKVGRVPL